MEWISNALFGFCVIQSWVFCFIFLFNSKKRKSLYILGLFLFIYSSGNIPWLLKSLGLLIPYPQLRYLPVGFFFLVTPVFYLYVKKILGLYKPRDWYHLLPGIIESLLLYTIFFAGDRYRNWLYIEHRNIIVIVYVYLWPLFSVVYLTITIFLVNKYQPLMTTIYSNTENKQIRWIRLTAIILLVSYISEFVSAYLQVFSTFNNYYTYVNQTVNLFVIYWVSISGLRQYELNFSSTVTLPEETNSKINPDEHQLFSQIENLIQQKALYKNKELTLYSLAAEGGINYRQVSRIINTYSGKNFSQYINQFRIEEAKRLLADGSADNLNLTGLANLVGFNSRSSFFSSFKQVTGYTPTEFKKMISNS